ncbi:MAG: flap endonuclease-1 [Candidatus Bilamarchaeaceae archaeon]
MGVDLGDIVVKNKITLANLNGKIIAIDAFNTLYQFLASIRQEDGTPLMDSKGNITGHLSGLFYRTSKMLDNGIKPVYVFDGKSSQLKERTKAERSAAKMAAREKWQKAIEEERLEDARKYAQATAQLTEEMVEESKKLLDAMGVPWVQAPEEGEAQAAMMAKNGIVYAVGSQDYDALLFGTPILIRNLSITGKRKVPRQNRFVLIEPEEIKLDETLKQLEITQEQLITIGILIGTDFNIGVKGIGPKTALKIVKEHKTFDNIIKYVVQKYGYTFEVEPEEVLEIFKEPSYDENIEQLKWKEINEDEVKKILVDTHDFAEERIESVITNLKTKQKEERTQKTLENWF